MALCNGSMFCCVLFCVHSSFINHLDGEERAGCIALFVFLVSRNCYVFLPHDTTGLFAVYNCGFS